MLEQIIESYPEETFLKADGLDGAIIGVCEDFNAPVRLVYSVKKESDLEEDETIESKKYLLALEHFNYNVSGGYVGDKTPIWCRDDF